MIPRSPTVSLTIFDSGTSPEIAAIMSYDNTITRQIKPRQLVIRPHDNSIQRIPTTSRLWEPLVFPLLFPHATLGWGLHEQEGINDLGVAAATDIPTTQMWHCRARLLHEERFQIFGRLTNEYLVDMFSRDLESRMAYIRANQNRLRHEDALLAGLSEEEASGNIYLPSSFLGSRRWSSEQIADSLAIAAALGNPTFFITMTCNPDWPEIKSQLHPGQTYADIPIVVVRVFKRKLALLEQMLHTMFPNAGKLLYIIHNIEFQRRGLPHAHILVKFAADCTLPLEIDAVVSAEMPTNSVDAALVRRFMLHKHPAADHPPSKYCQRVDSCGRRFCRFGYPHALQQFTTIDAEGRVHYRRCHAGDEMIVPHCLPVLQAVDCHVNFEVAATSHMFQYLFKYVHKGMN